MEIMSLNMEPRLEVRPSFYERFEDNGLVLGFNFICDNAKIKIIKGFSRKFNSMDLEVLVNFKDKRLCYNLFLNVLDGEKLAHGIVNLPEWKDSPLEEVFKNEKFNDGTTILEYLLENDFVLFESSGSYIIDEVYIDQNKK